MKDYNLHIIHILESVEKINLYCEKDKMLFLEDSKTQDSVLRVLQTLSESATKLPQIIKDKYSQIAWREIAGFRNILVHNYLEGIDSEKVWKIIESELPVLVEAMQKEFPNWKK